MRKKYVKPELYYENFELSQQIAACDYDSNNTHSDDNCFYTGTSEFGAMTVFMDNCGSEGSGTVNVEDYGYCYHNSTAYPIGIFNS